MDTTGDPWDARTLEWSTATPVPFYNFATIPEVHDRDAWWDMKQRGLDKQPKKYEDIEMPKNTPTGVLLGIASLIFAFAMTWHMFLIAAISVVAAIVFLIMRTFDDHTEYVLPASEIEKLERAKG